jgi:hypothetical protein
MSLKHSRSMSRTFVCFNQYIAFFRKVLLDPHPEDLDYAPLPEERPGGFNWGAAANEGQQRPR